MGKILSKLAAIGIMLVCIMSANNIETQADTQNMPTLSIQSVSTKTAIPPPIAVLSLVQSVNSVATSMLELSNVIATHAKNRDASFTIHYTGDIAAMRAGFDSMFSNLMGTDAEVNLFVDTPSYGMRYNSTDADINMSMTYFYTKEKEQYVTEQINTILAKIIIPTMSDFEKEEAINNWIYNNVNYDTTLKNKTSYEALKDGKTICTGYAMLAHTMLTAVDIKSQYITGTTHGTNHIWLMVSIGGSWYHYDPTKDSKINGKYYFFNQTDNYLTLHESVWDSTRYPAATTVYTPSVKSGNIAVGNSLTITGLLSAIWSQIAKFFSFL